MGLLVNLDELTLLTDAAHERGETIVLANGAFDLLHVGHVRYLQGAAEHGERVVVAVNSDSSVQLSKGPNRPMIPDAERAEIVAALAGIDWVVVFDDKTVEPIIEAIRPHVHAKGTDYTVESVPEAALVKRLGGRVEIVGDPKDHSTTELCEQLKEKPSE
ncbi:MAG: adenylyltransferase/cytidyltransferase family protein [Deltaproteobacteria bacterium]|jgi:D-glycero-beta-D-manno-heptose 1-phosphate adenylyltransferase|nr:adenylyltransferase/cytidyltransferase family protein [Deltaproteobacteria bacterium]MBT6436230.1 adenylyltransferase/cytidyltransferase family protein [Deltaproteobacteria bacterium]MBT6491304.1 adenylyltransferase/cytidyltransferase family protein [Deltaproteobacteria bacterium]